MRRGSAQIGPAEPPAKPPPPAKPQRQHPAQLQHGLTLSNVVKARPSRDGDKMRARHSFNGWISTTWSGNATFVFLMSSLLIFGCAGSWMATPVCDGCGVDDSFHGAMWFAWGIFFDPGTQTGLASDGTVTHSQRFIAAFFSILGFIFNLGLLGVVVEMIRSTISRFRAEYLSIIANDHLVVLGWSEKTLFLLAEAAQMLSDRAERGTLTMVILSEMNALEMKAEVKIVYPDWRKRWPRVRLRYMQGRPYEIDDLMRVSVFSARHVMVLGLSRRPREADSQVITMLCALRCLPVAVGHDCLVVAELRQAQTKSVARQLGASDDADGAEIVPVAAAQAVDALLVLCALSPVAGRALMHLMSFSGNQLEIVKAGGTPLCGKTFGEARKCFSDGVLIGLIRATGTDTGTAMELGVAAALARKEEDDEDEALAEEGVHASDSVYRDKARVQLAPAEDAHIRSSDVLVVIAADQKDAEEGLKGENYWLKSPPGSSKNLLPLPALLRESSRAEPAASTPAPRETAATRTPAAANPGAAARVCEEKKKILLVGWSLNLGSLLRAFDARLAKGSEMWVLGRRPLVAREVDMAADGLQLSGEALTVKSGEEALRSSVGGLSNLRIHHVVGFETDYLALRRLPVDQADLAVIIADDVRGMGDEKGWSEPQMKDSEAMTSTILLRRLRDEETARTTVKPAPLQVVTQLSDVLTHRLLRNTPALLNTSSSGPGKSNCADTLDFHRNYMETTTISVAAHNKDAWSALRTLIYPAGGSDLISISARHALPADELQPSADSPELSFWELSDKVRSACLGVLVGWCRAPRHAESDEKDEATPGLAPMLSRMSILRGGSASAPAAEPEGVPEINPVDKEKKLAWCEADDLLLVRKDEPPVGTKAGVEFKVHD